MNITTFSELYKDTDRQTARYRRLAGEFEELFGCKPKRYFSASGRTEVIGNHTDHNHGRVMAAAVNLDIIAAANANDTSVVTVKSEGFDADVIDISSLEPKPQETNKSASLIRGVCAGLKNRGYKIGGFDAYTTSDVLKGSGLSSSAAFEVLVGTIINHLYNDGKISAVEIAQVAQYAENVYFGKPSGLMDQMASSVGGFISIDFEDTSAPMIEAIDYDLSKSGYSLCIVDTRGSHAELTPEYAAIPDEMKAVAGYFGEEYLRQLSKQDVLDNVAALREKFGDRAVLRAFHFFDENERVIRLAAALKNGDFDAFLECINESGDSSYKYLQNVYAGSMPKNQSVSVALYMCDMLMQGSGASRVHGGGFAGTIQAFVKNDMLDGFINGMESVFGSGSCHVLNVRKQGGTEVTEVSL